MKAFGAGDKVINFINYKTELIISLMIDYRFNEME